MKRFDLPWYDVNYRDGSDYNTPAGKKIAELNNFLRENGIRWWIACLDEKGQTVQRYTDRVVLEIDDSVSPEKLEKIKKIVSELLKVMWTTETQLVDVFGDKETNRVNNVEVNNMWEYEREKFWKMKEALKDLVKTMNIIKEYVGKANKLWILVDKDFYFDKIYRTWWFDYTPWNVDFNDLRNKFMDYSYNLQKAVMDGKWNQETAKFIQDGLFGGNLASDSDKFDSIKERLEELIKTMDIIWEYTTKADNSWIYVKKDFYFDKIYRTWWFDYTPWQVDFNDLRNKFMDYSYNLQKAVAKKQKNK